MILKDLNKTAEQRVVKINKLLKEQFGFAVSEYPSKRKLEMLWESAQASLVGIRGSNKKFQLDPEYIKFLGIKDVVETMIREGMYAESPAYRDMEDFVHNNVKDLMDSGYSLDDTVREVMNRYRLDSRFAYPDSHVRELVMQCATDYIESFEYSEEQDHTPDVIGTLMPSGHHDSEEEFMPSTSKEIVLLPDVHESLARHFNVRPDSITAKRIVENKLEQFSLATGKSRKTIVEFLNKLSKTQLHEGIMLFDNKVKNYALQEKKNHKAKITQEAKKSTPRISLRALQEEVDMAQAEVAVAAKSLSSELQDQVEKLGRMLNEDLPAIVEQIRAEMGAQAAVAFRDSATQLLSGHLEATRQAQQTMEQTVSTISGEEALGAPAAAGAETAPAPEAGAEAGAAAPAPEAGDLEGLGTEGGEEAGLGRAEV